MSPATNYPPTFAGKNYDFVEYVTAKNWIAGEWCDASSGETLDIINPRYGKRMGTVQLSAAADVERAVAAAKKAQKGWKATPIKERVQVLYRLKQYMERDLEELSWLLSHENGKLFPQAHASVSKGIECVEFGIAVPNMNAGGQLDVSRGVNCSVTYEPLGVVAGVVPFNFPTMVPLWMMPQALVAGNAFVLKPSETVPYGAMKLAALLDEAGLPKGVFSVVHGQRAAVEAIVDHECVKAVGFVGSTAVAKALYARGSALGKRMLCLGGAKNFLIVAPDADFNLTTTNVPASAFHCAGQRCMAAAVAVVVGDSQHLVDGMIEYARGLDLGNEMGCVITPEAKQRIVGYIDDAEKRGAKIVVDGRNATVKGCEGGNWVGPTIIDHATPDMAAACEEIFGPVLTILRVDTLDEAIALENANEYGNAAAVFTTTGATARYVMERVEAGMCGVNIGVPVPREPFAFGGWNDSKFGHGDMTGWDGYRFWTRPRKVTVKWAEQTDQTWMG